MGHIGKVVIVAGLIMSEVLGFVTGSDFIAKMFGLGLDASNTLAAPSRLSPCHTHGREAGAERIRSFRPEPSGSSTAFGFPEPFRATWHKNWTVSRSGEFGGAKKNAAFEAVA
jgi:hypothetical protein